jgi:cytochrome oxidase Cu insertion factor (SCO1/SenC/PrrC family)
MTERSAQDKRQRRLLIGVALMFFAPLALSFYFYYGSVGWRPGGHVNKGELIRPARPLPAAALSLQDGGDTQPKFLLGKWTLLYVQESVCDAECLRRLYDTRQVRLALDREMGRVQRVLLGAPACCDWGALHAAHPDLLLLKRDARAAPLLEQLPHEGNSVAPERVYLIDPLGNLMMYYPPEAPAKGMLQDLKRLLQLSQIG